MSSKLIQAYLPVGSRQNSSKLCDEGLLARKRVSACEIVPAADPKRHTGLNT